MKEKCLLVLTVLLLCSRAVLAVEDASATPAVVRVGVDVRLGLQSCMDTWLPVMEYLSKAIPGHRFVVVPLASQEDVLRTLEKGDVDFVALDPAMELLANDRYDTTPLVTIAETAPDETKARDFLAACSGTIIRRADRSDIRGIQDIRGKRIAAVKPWSLTGWIAQWGLLEKDGIDPQRDAKQVVFLGTHEQVVKNVLAGEADIGTVSSDMLLHLIRCKKVSPESLCFINRKGLAVPLVTGENIASTVAYPGRVLSKTVGTSEDLAQRVAEALMKQSVAITVDRIPYQVRFRIACNYSSVRHLLQRLMGPHYAESSGFPLPRQYPAWLLPATVTGGGLLLFAIVFLVLRHRCVRRLDMLEEQLQSTRYELAQVRAERQRINAILALAGCGIDIIDEQNRIVYADPGLERKYGDWRGQKCHGFFCNSDTPCHGCKVPGPSGEQVHTQINIDGPPEICSDDPHAKVHYIEGESTQMLGIPFRDEGGRWLYARIHFPLMAFSGKDGSLRQLAAIDAL